MMHDRPESLNDLLISMHVNHSISFLLGGHFDYLIAQFSNQLVQSSSVVKIVGRFYTSRISIRRLITFIMF